MQTGKSTLLLEFLASDDPQVKSLSDRYGVDRVLGGTLVSWQGTIDSSSRSYQGERLLLWVGDRPDAPTGKFFSSLNSSQFGYYHLGNDEVLTLTQDTPDQVSEDRIWFASPNFRLRTSVTQIAGTTIFASLCTEIRLGS